MPSLIPREEFVKYYDPKYYQNYVDTFNSKKYDGPKVKTNEFHGFDENGRRITASSGSGSSSGSSAPASSSSNWANKMDALWQQHLGYARPVYKRLMSLSNMTYDWAKADRARWETMFKPLEDALIADALTYNTIGKQELEAGRAISDMSKAYQAQRENLRRNLESYGIDPSQTRAGALDQQARVGAMLGQVAAGNIARQDVENTGRALRDQAINLGANTAIRALQESQTSGQMADAAGGTMNNAFGTGASYMLGGGQLDLDHDKLQEAIRANKAREALAQSQNALAWAQFDEQYGGGTNWMPVINAAYEGIRDYTGSNRNSAIQSTPNLPGNATGTNSGGNMYPHYNDNVTFAAGGLVRAYKGGGNGPNGDGPGGAGMGGGPGSEGGANDAAAASGRGEGEGPGGRAGVGPAAAGDRGSPVQQALQGGVPLWAARQPVLEVPPAGARPGITARPMLPTIAGGAPPAEQKSVTGATPAKPQALPVYDRNGSVEGVGGPKEDLVPARLSPGEYVIPQEVVSWLGEKHFVQMRDKAHKDMQEEQVRNPPQYAPALNVGVY